MYKQSDHGHIKGDSNIINFNTLKNLMKNGTKFRNSSCTNINDIIKQFTYGIDLVIYKASYNKLIALITSGDV